ncbi:MAG: 16S rRNA (cytosine(1402)-N(4))-methyltransferase RsmH [Candidatus Omnitrophica bacterium]|nr:16S rRNA (cytosine(1402)-N(4))-methyltransferase RsmH [Candidatus Omnitrophota bacterium]
MKTHQPVMVEKVIEFLNVRATGVYIDATCGTGHHSRAILEATGGNCTMICIDKDFRAIQRAKEYLSEFSTRVIFVNDGFENIEKIVRNIGIKKADGILFDLGFSSEQISSSQAGFGFKQNGPLDMRYDKNLPVSAWDVINRFSKKEIARILEDFGEVKDAEKLATLICTERKNKPFETTREFADFIARHRKSRKKVHPATQIFQAIRMYVNNEIENLKAGLEGAVNVLISGARIVVITYHSIEDRIVKRFMKTNKNVRLITKKVIVPDEIEKAVNLSSRSAKMRVAEVVN